MRTILCLAALCFANATGASAEVVEGEVRAVLERHCIGCHGPDKQKSKIRFDTLSTDLINDRAAAETWHDALHAIQLGEMPPEDEPPMAEDDRALVTAWIQGQIDAALAATKDTGGRGVIRRLNRDEYQYAMTDLLGVDLDFAGNLPPDSVSEEGFSNNGAVLSMSPLQLEYYLEAARRGLRAAIVTGAEPEVHRHLAERTVSDRKDQFSERLGREGVFVARIPEFPDTGVFEMRIRARAENVDGKGHPRMHVRFGYRADTQAPAEDVGTVDVVSEQPQDYVFRQRLEAFPIQSRTQSKFPGMLVWIRNVYDDGGRFESFQTTEVETGKDGKKKKVRQHVEDPDFPKIVIESFEFVAPSHASWPPESHRSILFESELRENDERAYAEAVIELFASRAFRRPLEAGELADFVSFYDHLRPAAETLEEAMQEALAMVLVSPQFLYLVEPAGDRRRPLNDHELAARLALFLWGSLPDDELRALADRGELASGDTLAEQVDRLLGDGRSRRFVKQFCDQWLDLAGVDRVAVNPEYYDDFDDSLKAWMQEETRSFFAEILQHDLSALSFLDSDFVMLNEPLAKHYGVDGGPRGTAFERVAVDQLPDKGRGRGGLLGQASILLANSTGEDSHPILRAVWLRDRLLDDPPAPPPPNVPELDGESPDLVKLPVREQLELHREDPACADCHRGIDPWGVALEHFDAVGLWRDVIRRREGEGKRPVWHEIPVTATAELPGGVAVDGVDDMKRHLVDERADEFARALTARLLSYALGRSLELSDEATIDALAADFADSDYRLRQLIVGIVQSELFRSK